MISFTYFQNVATFLPVPVIANAAVDAIQSGGVALGLEQDEKAFDLKSPCDFDRILYKTTRAIVSENLRGLDSSSLFSGTSIESNAAVGAILPKVALEQDMKALKSPCEFDVTYDASFGAIDVSNKVELNYTYSYDLCS